MKRLLTIAASVVLAMAAQAAEHQVKSPDGQLVVSIASDAGKASYSVSFEGTRVIESSALGLTTTLGDYANSLTLKEAKESTVDRTYEMHNSKQAQCHYKANTLTLTYENADKRRFDIEFQVSDNNVAFRYLLFKKDDRAAMIVQSEATAFKLASDTRTFICPQSSAMIGWERTKPSYEEEYNTDAPLTDRSKYGQGYTFPCLFRLGDIWTLISETGVNGTYVGSHLSDWDAAKGYSIAFPMEGENNGIGQTGAGMLMDCKTPWRTITVGRGLKSIVETTIAWDVVEQQYEPSQQYKPGRYTWSWLIWQDNSINYDDQVKFIDTAAEMGYEYCLVDGCWDVTIGRDRIAQLSQYAQKKGVSLLLWYNSNGFENDALQTPKNCMNSSTARHREMKWMKSIGVKGIKVDFFGGDKQLTMQLYEDILADANLYGLQVIFHGCTLPRGWERMYPNFVASEAVLASENTYFSEHHAQREAFELTMHPFCRNTVAAMDWGGTLLNKFMSQDNKSRHRRYTTDAFEMAAAIMNQTFIQCIAIQPNNLQELPEWELEWLKQVPTQWKQTRFIDGYPGRYAVLARQSASDGKWFVVGMNAEEKEKTLSVATPYEKGTTVTYYNDYGIPKQLKVGKGGIVKVKMQTNGGFVLN